MTIETTKLNDEQIAFSCWAISKHGSGDHPEASTFNLPYFRPGYLRECLEKAKASDDLNSIGMKIADEVIRILA